MDFRKFHASISREQARGYGDFDCHSKISSTPCHSKAIHSASVNGPRASSNPYNYDHLEERQSYATGGHVSSHQRPDRQEYKAKMVKMIADQGRGEDTKLAAMGPRTMKMMDNLVHHGHKQVNLRTGLREFKPCCRGTEGCAFGNSDHNKCKIINGKESISLQPKITLPLEQNKEKLDAINKKRLEEELLPSKHILDMFDYPEKKNLQKTSCCAIKSAKEYADYLKKTRPHLNIKTNDSNSKTSHVWQDFIIKRNNQLYNKKSNKDLPKDLPDEELKTFANEANAHDRYAKDESGDYVNNMIETPEYLKDHNYIVEEYNKTKKNIIADLIEKQKQQQKQQIVQEEPKNQLDLPQRLKFINDALSKNVPVAIGTKIKYPKNEEADHNFLITGSKKLDQNYREQKCQKRKEKLMKIQDKPQHEPQRTQLIKQIMKYDKTKDASDKIYYADYNREGKQNGYLNPKKKRVYRMEYDDLSKKWKEPDIFLFGEENNEIPHLSYVKGYRNKNEEESPLPPIDMKKIEFNQFE